MPGKKVSGKRKDASSGYKLSSTSYVFSCLGFLILTILIFLGSYNDSRKNLEAQFRTDALRRIQVVQSLLQNPREHFRTLESFFVASEAVTRDEFILFTRGWIDSGTFTMIGWIPPEVHSSSEGYAYPVEDAKLPLLLSQRPAAEKARADRMCMVSGAFHDGEHLLMLFCPVFMPEDRGNAYKGTLFGEFDLAQLLSKPLSDVPPLGLSFTIYPGTLQKGAPFFTYDDEMERGKGGLSNLSFGTALQAERVFPFADRTWTMVVYATPGYVAEHASFLPWLLLFGGLLLSILLAVYLYQRAVQKKAFVEKVHELDSFFTLNLDLLCITDTDGHFLRLNPEWERALGYSVDFLLGRKFFDFIHPDDLPATLDAVESLTTGDMVTGFENRYRCSDGSYKWVEWRSVSKNKFIYAAARDITERLQWEKRLLHTLKEKDILLKEVHHRVKNNLQMITSMLNLEREKTADPRVKEQLLRNQHRIHTIAMVHESLYMSDTMSGIDFSAHIKDLISLYQQTETGLPVSYILEVDCETLPLGTALPCGLIVNELLTNSVQHALPGVEEPKITITFTGSRDDRDYLLTISDNGPGMPELSDPSDPNGLGLQIVRALTDQINGSLEVINDSGAVFRIRFPAEPVT